MTINSEKIKNALIGNKKLSCIIACTIIGLQITQSALGWGNIESKLIYYPMNKHIADVRIKVKSPIEDTYFYSLDGVKLNGWYIKAQRGKPTIIYCHGQGENISLWQSVAQTLSDNGYGVFMIDYRGHGRSEGIPSESGLYTDLESAVEYLNDFKKVKKDNIVLWGRSLGGAVVADVASRDTFKGVIMESTFTNIRDAAIHLTESKILESDLHFWSNLSSNFVKCMPMTQKFETDEKIEKISSPLLIAHSVNDETIPASMSYELAKLNPHAQLFISEEGSHHSSEWVKPRVLEFLKSLN